MSQPPSIRDMMNRIDESSIGMRPRRHFEIGQRAIYGGMLGMAAGVPCTIDSEGFKGGEHYYGCTLDTGEQRWGYDEQFSNEIAEDNSKRVMVKGRDVYIDGTRVGEVGGGRFRHKGVITPTSGYYLRFPNNSRMYVTDEHPTQPTKGVFAYAKDLIQQIGWDADEVLAKAAENGSN